MGLWVTYKPLLSSALDLASFVFIINIICNRPLVEQRKYETIWQLFAYIGTIIEKTVQFASFYRADSIWHITSAFTHRPETHRGQKWHKLTWCQPSSLEDTRIICHRAHHSCICPLTNGTNINSLWSNIKIQKTDFVCKFSSFPKFCFSPTCELWITNPQNTLMPQITLEFLLN